MDRTRFEALLDAYGADAARWPEEERAAAQAFAAAHAQEVAPLVAAARALDGALGALGAAPAPSEFLSARVLAGARKHVRGDAFAPRSLALLAACAVFGLVAGMGGGALMRTSPDEETLVAAMFEAPSVGDTWMERE